MKPSLVHKLRQIRLLLLDVDGVLTDGSIVYSDSGNETKRFNAKDGLGIKLLMESGIKVGIVTGRDSKALMYRCKNLGISTIYAAVRDKAGMLDSIIETVGGSAENTAYIGDDLPDIALMARVGLSIAVADAHEYVRQHADWVTAAKGGCGAVREVCEMLLQAQGLWDAIIKRF